MPEAQAENEPNLGQALSAHSLERKPGWRLGLVLLMEARGCRAGGAGVTLQGKPGALDGSDPSDEA